MAHAGIVAGSVSYFASEDNEGGGAHLPRSKPVVNPNKTVHQPLKDTYFLIKGHQFGYVWSMF